MKFFCIPFGSSSGNFNVPPADSAPRGQYKQEAYNYNGIAFETTRVEPKKELEPPPPKKVQPKELEPPPPKKVQHKELELPPQNKVQPKELEPPHPKKVQPKELERQSSKISVHEKRTGIIGRSMDPELLTADEMKTRRVSKDSSSQQLIKDAIMANEFLNNLDPAQVDAMVEAMYVKSLTVNSYVITEGEPGSHLYVSAEGIFEVIKEGKRLGQFGPGTAFGELAILYNSKRMASIRVLKESKVWVLDRREFQKIMMRTGLQKREENVKFLRSVPLLHNLNEDVLTKMSDLLQVEFYTTSTTIVKQGDRGDAFFIISGGNVKITKKEPSSEKEHEVGQLGRGGYFGELALLKEDRRQATVTALDPGVECLILERVPFVQLLGDLQELQKGYTTSSPSNVPQTRIKQEYDNIKLSDLDVVGTLGVGGFGRVELVQYRKDKSLTFALKCLKKVHVVEQQQEEHAYNEKAVMLQCRNCPFISKLYRTYRDSKYVYFLMEPCLGGDVFTVLQKNRFFDDRTARFMTACVVEALEYLHERGFIFRDLKPENLLLDARGYIKMIDFGFAKSLGTSGKTWTFAGTPEYVAPEIILNKGHDRAVDYWALGVLMHEFLTGRPPFRGSDHMKTYNLILKGIDAVQFPKYVQRAATHLIKRLCRAGATERLGYQKAGVRDIKTHKWFQGFDWIALKNRTMKAPIIQPVSGPTDISNFDKYKNNTEDPPVENSGWDKDF